MLSAYVTELCDHKREIKKKHTDGEEILKSELEQAKTRKE